MLNLQERPSIFLLANTFNFHYMFLWAADERLVMNMVTPDWVNGIMGGLMIGSAAALFLLANGAIMGASGLLGGFVDGSGRHNWAERVLFLVGLIAMPAVALAAMGITAQTHATGNLWVLIAAGLCVGVGTRLANGCTSGHGVCGIPRLSLRGIMATVFYILAGGISVFLFRHVWGLI